MVSTTKPYHTDVRCQHGLVFHNYSLFYGRRAGNFTDRGEVKNMDECLRLCCGELSCKMALMLDRNCYSVACVDKFCRTVPVKVQLSKLKIAHVIRRKNDFFARQPYSHHPPGVVSYNVTLHQHHAPPGAHDGMTGYDKLSEPIGGEKGEASNHSNSIQSKERSVKFPYKVFEMSENEKPQNGSQKQSLFVFREFDKLDTLLNLSIIHKKRALEVSNYLVDIGKATIETGMRMVQIHLSHEPQSHSDKNAVKIGRRLISAGERILSRGEKVMKAVTRPKSVKLSTVSKSLTPAVGVHVVTPVIKMISLCSHGPSHYGVTLLGGIRAGHFVGHGKVDNMRACIKMCCENPQCDLAFMVKNDCYSVICYHKNLCRSVRAQHAKKYRPQIARVWRGAGKETQTESNDVKESPRARDQHMLTRKMSSVSEPQKGGKVSASVKSRPRSRGLGMSKAMHHYHVNSEAGATITGASKNNTNSVVKMKESVLLQHQQQQQQQNVSNTFSDANNGTGLFSSTYAKGNPSLENAINSPDNVTINVDFREKDIQRSRVKFAGVKPRPRSSTSRNAASIHHGASPTQSLCSHTSVKHSVGLRSGLKTGKFTYIGELLDITACLKICCNYPDCDIAFMLDQSCYTVSCVSEKACHSVPYHQHKYSTAAIFVTRRFNTHAHQLSSFQISTTEDRGTEDALILQNRTKTTRTFRQNPDLINSPRGNDSIGTDNHRLKYAVEEEQTNSDTHNGSHENNTVMYRSKKQPSSYENLAEKINSSGKWKHERINIFLSGGKGLKSDDLNIRSNSSLHKQWQHYKIKINFADEEKSKDDSTLSAHVKSDLDGKQNEKESGKESRFSKHGQISDEVHNETIVVSFQSLPRETVQSVLESGLRRLATQPGKPSHQEEALAQAEDHWKENGSETTRREMLKTKGSIKATLATGGKKPFFQGESDFYEQAHESADRSSDWIQETEETMSGESGWMSDFSPRIRVRLGDVDKVIQGEPLYYNYEPVLGNPRVNSGRFPQAYEESGSSRSDVSGPSFLESDADFNKNEPLKDSATQNLVNGKDKSLVARNCSTVTSFYNVTFLGGSKAGNFTFFGEGLSKAECVTHCCVTLGCDATLMVLDRCFLVHCDGDNLCDVVAARNADKYKPVITFVNLTLINALRANANQTDESSQFDTQTLYKETGAPVREDKHETSPIARSRDLICSFSRTFHNVSFRLGRKSGIFTHKGPADNIGACAQRCCESLHCDVAFMISQDCFSVRCHDNKTCQTFGVDGSNFNPRMIFVGHQGQLRKNSNTMSMDSLVNRSSLHYDRSSQTRTASNLLTGSLENYSKSTLRLELTSQSFHRTELSSFNITPSRSSSWSAKATNATRTYARSPKSDLSRKFQDYPSDFVEVKTNGSEFWWQYYSPNEKHATNSSLNTAIVGARDDSDMSAVGSLEDLSARSITQSRSVVETSKNASKDRQESSKAGDTSFKKSGIETMVSNSFKDGSNLRAIFMPHPQDISGNSLKNSSSESEFSQPGSTPRFSSNSSLRLIANHRNLKSLKFYNGTSKESTIGIHEEDKHDSLREDCKDAEVLSGVTLKGGYYAGLFSRQDNVNSVSECASKCCRLPKCNLAFMFSKICYAVQCFSQDKCVSVKAHFASKYHPRVAYIRPFTEKSWEGGFNAHASNHEVFANTLRCSVDAPSEPQYKVRDGSFIVHLAVVDLGDCAKLCCLTDGCEVALQENDTCYSLNCHGGLKCPEISVSKSSRSLGVIKDLFQPTRRSERLASKSCDFSQVLRDVVLRGGSHSGTFKFVSDVADMKSCIAECCKHKVCDAALMLSDDCFLVSCHSEVLCDAVPSRSSKFHLQLAYKIKHEKRRNKNMGKHEHCYKF